MIHDVLALGPQGLVGRDRTVRGVEFTRRCRCTWIVSALLTALLCRQARGDDKPPKPDANLPQVKLCLPLGVAPASTAKIVLRGAKLDNADRVEASDGIQVKLLSKGKANLPQGADAAKVGDTQVEVEVVVSANVGENVTFNVVTPAGKSEPFRILVDKNLTAASDKEPNGGFRAASPIAVGQYVDGLIERGQDVDVYRLEGKAGQKLGVEVLAARHGSPLDALITLYGAAGQTLANCDDIADSRDAQIEFLLTADGPYYIAIQDANDQGSGIHEYRLRVTQR